MGTIPADIIILGFIAGFILYKLYTILGQKDDDGNFSSTKQTNNIIDISHIVKPVEDAQTISEAEKMLSKGFEDVVNKIRTLDASFSLEKFLKGAKSAFEMILTAFAENDRQTLENLLDNKTYTQFLNEIDGRLKNGINLNLTLVALPIVEIKNITIENKKIFIEVFYQSQQITILKNSNGEIVEGDASQVDTVNDTWIYSKELNSRDSWHLVKVTTA